MTASPPAQGQAITRRDAQSLFYNLLCAKNSFRPVLSITLGQSVTAGGEAGRAGAGELCHGRPRRVETAGRTAWAFPPRTFYLNGAAVSSPTSTPATCSIRRIPSAPSGPIGPGSPDLWSPPPLPVRPSSKRWSDAPTALDGEAVTLAMSDVGGARGWASRSPCSSAGTAKAARADDATPGGNYEKTVLRGVLMSKAPAPLWTRTVTPMSGPPSP